MSGGKSRNFGPKILSAYHASCMETHPQENLSMSLRMIIPLRKDQNSKQYFLQFFHWTNVL